MQVYKFQQHHNRYEPMNFFHCILFTILNAVHVSSATPIKPIEPIAGLEGGIKPIHKEIQPLDAIFAGEIEFKQKETETPMIHPYLNTALIAHCI